MKAFAGKKVVVFEKAVSMGFNNWDLLETDRGWENIRGSLYYRQLVKNRSFSKEEQ